MHAASGFRASGIAPFWLFLSIIFCYKIQAAEQLIATYSIVAFDPQTGDLGVAVQSKFLAVGAVVPWAKAGVGAVATQSWTNTTFGPRGLELMAEGKSAQQALKILIDADQGRNSRQLGIIDAQGRAASYTGEDCMAWAGHKVGKHFAVQGNILAGEAVVKDMAVAFRQARKQRQKNGTQLADWLVAGLMAAEAAGGDKRGRQSSALLVVREKAGYSGYNDRYIDLRVDDHQMPVKELSRLLDKRFRRINSAMVPADKD